MSSRIGIRESVPDDLTALEALYPAAFPEEDLLPLVRQLADGRDGILSLVAVLEDSIVAHLALSACGIAGTDHRVALLGPAAVAPGRQGEGIGDALIRDGLDRLRKAGFVRVQVLGDPNYYSRFGFRPDRDVRPPYRLPDEWRDAWQFQPLDGNAAISGDLTVPEPWLPEALWQP
ncbi:MAG: GNAT family N-acetyltransferase [Minwuia sp.]|uniref:GNAT family N-acetyltransferase n=1 Tax=Minwuia sp. TaxID=2493630 RepID=UPI003A8629A1